MLANRGLKVHESLDDVYAPETTSLIELVTALNTLTYTMSEGHFRDLC